VWILIVWTAWIRDVWIRDGMDPGGAREHEIEARAREDHAAERVTSH
jgi:hypothetical protein